MSRDLQSADQLGDGVRPLGPHHWATGVGRYLLFAGGLAGFFGGASYGTMTFWFADRTGDPGSIVDVRLFSPMMGILAGALATLVGVLSGLAAWWAVSLVSPAVGERKRYLAAALGGAPVTAILSWLLLRNLEPGSFTVASGAGFVAITSTSALVAARLNARRSRRIE